MTCQLVDLCVHKIPAQYQSSLRDGQQTSSQQEGVETTDRVLLISRFASSFAQLSHIPCASAAICGSSCRHCAYCHAEAALQGPLSHRHCHQDCLFSDLHRSSVLDHQHPSSCGRTVQCSNCKTTTTVRTCAAAVTPLLVACAMGLLLTAQTASTRGGASASSSSRLQNAGLVSPPHSTTWLT